MIRRALATPKLKTSRKEEIRRGSNALSSVDASSGCIVSRAASQMKSPGDFLYPGRYTLYARRQ
jgi:hypothetical protein